MKFPKCSLQLGRLLESMLPLDKVTPLNISGLSLDFAKDGGLEGACNPAITSLFKNGKQWANLTDFTVSGFDIRENSVGDIGNWMKEQKKLKQVNIINCFMTPVILAEILEYVGQYLKTNPPDWDNEVTFTFDQCNTKKFLENDETRKILYDFLNKQKDTQGFTLSCFDETEPMTSYRWNDDVLFLWY